MRSNTYIMQAKVLGSFVLLGTMLGVLTGCSGFEGASFPDATPVATASELGPLSGNVYGGHAPLVGAHVYLVQPGTTGYGSQVTSLLTSSTYNPSFPLSTNGSFTNTSGSDQFVPAGFQGVTTDATGSFYISGDYTCTAGQPVVLIAYGGSPSYAGAGPNVFNVSSASTYNNGTTGVYFSYTISSSIPELFYIGEPVAVTGGSGGGFNQSGTVVASAPVQTSTTGTATVTPLSTTEFSILIPYNGGNPIVGSGTPSGLSISNAGQIVTATPAFNPAAVNMSVLGNCPSTLPISTVSIAGSTSPYTVTVTNTGSNNLAPGNVVTFAGITGAASALNGLKGQIKSAGLSATAFTATVTTGTALTAGTSTNGTYFAGFNNISYIYTNEISTTATAYAFAGFTNTTSTSLAGYDEFHIGGSGSAQSNQALANAATTAGNLYDIQGSNTAVGNPDGDVHIARTTTPSGTGTVSTTLINTIGNILASCVDSANTYRIDLATGAQSPQCKQLDQYVQDNGYYDTSSITHQSANIAQAAFSLARFPQGAGTATTASGIQTVTAGTATTASNFMSALVALPAGNVPFTPYSGGSGNTPVGSTGAVNDFAVSIEWANTIANGGTTASLSHVSIDASGNAWGAAAGGTNGTLFQYAPSGVITPYTGTASTANNPSVAIDTNGNVWMPGATGIYKFTPGTTAGVQVGAANATLVSEVEVDSAVNQYFLSYGGDIGTGTAIGSFLGKQSVTGTAAGGNFPIYGTNNPIGPNNTAGDCANYVDFLTLDSSNNIWVTDAAPGFNQITYVCRFNSSGTLAWSAVLPYNQANQAGLFSLPHTIAIDKAGNAYFADKNANLLYKVTAGTTTTNGGYVTLGGTLQAPRAIAIDGANTVWVTNTGDNGATTGAKAPIGLVQFSITPAQLTPNYITGGVVAVASTTASTGLNLNGVAIDPSGNLWTSGSSITAGTSTPYLFEFVGLATPAVTPLAVAKAASTTGTKP